MHLSAALLHKYIPHRNFIITQELLVVLRDTCIYIKGMFGFPEMQNTQVCCKSQRYLLSSLENLVIFTSVPHN